MTAIKVCLLVVFIPPLFLLGATCAVLADALGWIADRCCAFVGPYLP
ncbi:MAG: hypothetical protein ACYDH9_08070 [Limisphaerales bacterium]